MKLPKTLGRGYTSLIMKKIAVLALALGLAGCGFIIGPAPSHFEDDRRILTGVLRPDSRFVEMYYGDDGVAYIADYETRKLIGGFVGRRLTLKAFTFEDEGRHYMQSVEILKVGDHE